MENTITLNALKELTVGDILKLEKQQSGIDFIIKDMKRRCGVIDAINEEFKSGNFAEDLVNELD